MTDLIGNSVPVLFASLATAKPHIDSGKVRASISIMPAEKLKDGSTYPETVLLRLITTDGRPSVKISATTDGSGMALSDGQGLSYVQVLARGDKPEINIVDKSGQKATTLP